MFDAIKTLFGLEKTDYSALIKNGAIILDVRSNDEFKSGHIKGSINIPVQNLRNQLSQLKDKQKPIITCCASGIRSATAKSILLNSGYSEVYNGGSWSGLNQKI